MLAERVGFEPTCRLRDKTLSRRPRYDLFGTSPFQDCAITRTLDYRTSPSGAQASAVSRTAALVGARPMR